MTKTHRVIIILLTALWALATSNPASAQEVAWSDQFGTTEFDAVYAVDEAQGDVYGIGEVDDAPGGCDVIARAYEGSGVVKWTRQFDTGGCDFAEGIGAARGGVYIGGAVQGMLPGQTYAGAFDAFVRKYDEDGNELWTRQFGSAANDFVRAVAVDANVVYVVGSVRAALPGQTYTGQSDAFIRKYDADGNELWTRQFGTPGIDAARDVAVANGGVFVVGQVQGTLPAQTRAGGTDVFVRKYTSSGTEMWTHQFGSAGEDTGWGVDVNASAVYVAGDVAGALPDQDFAGGPLDAFVRRYSTTGKETWTRQFGTAGFDRAIRVAAEGGNVAVVGRAGDALTDDYEYAGGVTDCFVRLFDPDGNDRWILQFGSAMDPEAATGVVLSPDGEDAYVSGGIGGSLPGEESAGYIDAFVMKIHTNDG